VTKLLLAAAMTMTGGVIANASEERAVAVVRTAIEAQGGEQALRALRAIQFDAVGCRSMVDQSERPEGPYVTEFDRITETHDLAGN
jgi:hypothetical protein